LDENCPQYEPEKLATLQRIFDTAHGSGDTGRCWMNVSWPKSLSPEQPGKPEYDLAADLRAPRGATIGGDIKGPAEADMVDNSKNTYCNFPFRTVRKLKTTGAPILNRR
jgi:hypothetical protein